MPAEETFPKPRSCALHRRVRGGFTILEAAFASAIVTVVLGGLFVLQSNLMRMLASSTETPNASAHLQTRVNLPGLKETYTVSPYQSPCSGAPAATPPPPFTVTRQADGTLAVTPTGYAYTALLGNQEMLQVDLSITWPSLGRPRTRTQSTLVSPWGISK